MFFFSVILCCQNFNRYDSKIQRNNSFSINRDSIIEKGPMNNGKKVGKWQYYNSENTLRYTEDFNYNYGNSIPKIIKIFYDKKKITVKETSIGGQVIKIEVSDSLFYFNNYLSCNLEDNLGNQLYESKCSICHGSGIKINITDFNKFKNPFQLSLLLTSVKHQKVINFKENDLNQYEVKAIASFIRFHQESYHLK